jgi:hypothetical protein
MIRAFLIKQLLYLLNLLSQISLVSPFGKVNIPLASQVPSPKLRLTVVSFFTISKTPLTINRQDNSLRRELMVSLE